MTRPATSLRTRTLATIACLMSTPAGFGAAAATTRPAARPAASVASRPASAPAATAFALPNRRSLDLIVPAGWKVISRRSPRPNIPPTIEFTGGRAGTEFSLQVSVVPPPGDEPNYNSADRLRQVADVQLKGMLPSSKDQDVRLDEIKGEHSTAYVFTLADKDPNPGSFEYVTAGVAGVGDLLLAVTFLHHQKDAPERALALGMLKTAKQGDGGAAAGKAPAAATAPAAAAGVRFHAPAAGATAPAWDLVLPVDGLKVVNEKTDPSGRRKQVMAVDEETGLVVSIFMEPAARPGGQATAVRDLYWGRMKQSPLPMTDVKLDKAGEFATVEYVVAEIGGQKVNQRHLNLYAAHEGVWLDVHLSKVNFAAADREAFDRVLKGAKFERAVPAKK